MSKWIEHPLIKPEKIESRLYQQILAAGVLKKGNSMIVAPTALGKTIVAVLVAAERIQKIKNSKILILAPSKPLVVQHEESFRAFLKITVTSITGDIKPEDRTKRWQESQVICATPQTVESDLISGKYTLKNVSLLVFDECHRGVGSYSYVFLASKYIKDSKNPLILGLTASPGWDEERVKSVCENLFIKDVVIKNEEDKDVSPYFNPVEVNWVKVELPQELKDIKTHMEKTLKSRLMTLKKMGIISSIVNVSKKDILRAKSLAQNRIGRSIKPPKKCFVAISLLSAVINILHAIELLETQGISNLEKYFHRLRSKKTKAAKGLINDKEFNMAIYLTHKAFNNDIEHPKLEKLVEILKKELKKKDSKIIVFTQYRDTVEKIYQKCVGEDINAVKFFGQAPRENEKGLTQKEQKKIIKAFKMGVHDVLISTSVAEEGIDIPAVDLVILYEPVPSEIRMIQRRGRTGRKDKGRMFILMTKGTRDEAYYWSSINKEKQMRKTLDNGYQQDLKVNILNKTIEEGMEVIGNDYCVEEELTEEINESSEETEDLEKEKNVDNSIKENKYVEPGDFDVESVIPLIYADSREQNSKVLRELHNLNIKINIKSLAVADYQVSDEVAIERKTAKDFVSSIIDKRLYKQAKELVENFNKPLIILEGDDLYSGFIHPNAIRGALASVTVDFGIPIIPTRSQEDTAAMIFRIALREQMHERPEIQIRTEKKPLTIWEQQLYIIESLPNVGPVTAKKLMEEFGSVTEIICASEEELKKVEGIGKKIARQIRNVLDSNFKTIKPIKEKKLINDN
ncbi:MAG: Hef nuclease [Methanobacterium sp. BRmetb2]|jgi:Fanconi anemia group M protein|nr:MAG: Hef nuclease [Methanobacterium sp. BRmetb2]